MSARETSSHRPAAADHQSFGAASRVHSSTEPPTNPHEPQLTPEPTTHSGFAGTTSGYFEPTSETKRRTKRRCSGATGDGYECRAFAHGESDLCIFHDPAYRGTQRQNSVAGGKRSGETRRLRPHPVIPVDVSTPASRADFLGFLIGAQLQGRLSHSQSSAINRALSLVMNDLPNTRQDLSTLFGFAKPRRPG